MNEVLISNGKITKDGKKIDSIFQVLNRKVNFHEKLTVYGLFKALKPFSHEVSQAFYCQLGGSNFEKYLDEADKKVINDSHTDDIDYCEIHWAIDYTKVKKYEAFYEWPDFHGCRNKQKMTYGLDFSPINSYKNKPLILNKTYDLSLLHIVDKKTVRTPIIKTKKEFTFFEAIGGFLNDLSFYGPPTLRDKKSKEIFDDTEADRELLKALDSEKKKPIKK